MPTLTLTAPGPLVAGVHITGHTIREATVADLPDGSIEVEIGDLEVGCRLVGPADILEALLDDALTLLRSRR